MRDKTKRTLTVVIENVTEAQEIALNDLFATWQPRQRRLISVDSILRRR